MAVGLAHRQGIEVVTAFVVFKPGAAADEAALIGHCRQRRGRHVVPKRIVFIDQMPATATGKVQKNLLRERFRALYADESE